MEYIFAKKLLNKQKICNFTLVPEMAENNVPRIAAKSNACMVSELKIIQCKIYTVVRFYLNVISRFPGSIL